MGSERYLCERCGGIGQQIAELWNPATEKYDALAGVCDDCKGSGYLGPATVQPLDLDALLAIDAKRTPGEWRRTKPPGGKYAAAIDNGSVVVAVNSAGDIKAIASTGDIAAIVSAVNALRPLVERYRLAERQRRLAAGELTGLRLELRGRDALIEALLERCERAEKQAEELLVACKTYVPSIIQDAIAAVEGGADGKA